VCRTDARTAIFCWRNNIAACYRSILAFLVCFNLAYKTPRLRIIVIIAIIVDWVDPRKPNKKIQTDLDFGCWVSLFLRIERFSLTYLFAQTKLGTAPSFLHTIPDGLK